MSIIRKSYTMIEGDSFSTGRIQLDMAWLLAMFDISDLTNSSISAAFKDSPTGTTVPILSAIDDADAGIVNASFITYPPALALGTDPKKVYTMDIQLIDSTDNIKITVVTACVIINWQADEV